MSEDQRSEDQRGFEYAWGYFSVHATQRMQSVYFFLLAATFLMAAYGAAVVNKLHFLGLATGVLGALVAYIFHRLDRRVRSLIHAAEDALRPIESLLAERTKNRDLRILDKVGSPVPGSWSYTKLYRYLFVVFGLAFSAGALYSTWRLVPDDLGYAAAFGSSAGVAIVVSLLLAGYELFLLTVGVPEGLGRVGAGRPRWLTLLIAACASLCIVTAGILAMLLALKVLSGS